MVEQHRNGVIFTIYVYHNEYDCLVCSNTIWADLYYISYPNYVKTYTHKTIMANIIKVKRIRTIDILTSLNSLNIIL